MKKVAAHPSCGTDDVFVARVTGRLTTAASRDFDRHLRTCPACRMRLSSFKSARGRLERMFSKTPRRQEIAPAHRLLSVLLSQVPEKRLYYGTLVVEDFGGLLLAATDSGLCFVSFRPTAESEYLARWAKADFTVTRGGDRITAACKQLKEYFAGSRRAFDLDVDLHLVSDLLDACSKRLAESAGEKCSPTTRWPSASGNPVLHAPWEMLLGRTPCRSWCLATGWWPQMASVVLPADCPSSASYWPSRGLRRPAWICSVRTVRRGSHLTLAGGESSTHF